MSPHCGTCSCGVAEYGVTFVGGVKDGDIIGPLDVKQIAYWNRNWWSTVRLVIRVRPEREFRIATDDEVDAWNLMLSARAKASA